MVLHLAFRYATCRVVNIVACLAIALCVTVQIVSMAVMDGSMRDYQRRILGLGEQVTLFMPPGDATAGLAGAIGEALQTIPGVRGVSPGLKSYGVATSRFVRQPVLIQGIDIEAESRFGALAEFVLDQPEPRWTPPASASAEGERPGILLGAGLAEALVIDSELIHKGAAVHLEYVRWQEDKLIRQAFRVASRFRTGIDYFDSHVVYIPLSAAQTMFSPPDKPAVTQIAIWLEEPERARDMKEELLARANRVAEAAGAGPLTARTAEEAWTRAFRAMAYENALLDLVMGLISLSSGFAIFAIMYTLVASRIRDIGVLRSIGTSRLRVAAVFLTAGAFIGITGAALGAAGGVGLALHINEVYAFLFGEPLYPPYLFGIEGMPVHLDSTAVTLRAAAAGLMSLLATVPVAVWAGFRQPLEALRHE